MSEEHLSIKERGTYLITGGLGGIGKKLSSYLLANYRDIILVLIGRSELNEKNREFVSNNMSIEYRVCDITNFKDCENLIESITKCYGDLNGIFHCAGIHNDQLIVRKDTSEFKNVLMPKVCGTANLDNASRNCNLDFFVMFSSLASIIGNVGQADYAVANAFMDNYAKYRNDLVAQGKRRGRTISINWPLWEDGGMEIDEIYKKQIEKSTGLIPLSSGDGLAFLKEIMQGQYTQSIPVKGDISKIQNYMIQEPDDNTSRSENSNYAGDYSHNELKKLLIEKIKGYIEEEIKIDKNKLRSEVLFTEYGIDSVISIQLINKLEQEFGILPKTLFFEYPTIEKVAEYFYEKHANKCMEIFNHKNDITGEQIANNKYLIPRIKTKEDKKIDMNVNTDIAIVGVAGRYPKSKNLTELWDNLKEGVDMVGEIPPERWDYRRFYSSEKGIPGKSYCKWGAFMDDADKFDPLFFGIPPMEAEFIDPQERIFLQTSWDAMEDAGYAHVNCQNKKVGVFVGVMYGLYQLYSVTRDGNKMYGSSSYASVANRVSYFLNLKGPSIAVDTMCSSSLTAIHLACNSIILGECDMAIAGGVNIASHYQKYIQLCQNNFLSSDGKCRSFGEGGDGYVPGEGTGAVVLKKLENAVADGDYIYGVIKGSAINSGGKTSGFTVPDSAAQAEVIEEALKRANVNPATIGYIEAHGTGTALGDPIEISGLTKVYKKYCSTNQGCAIGSIKSNMGHLESAAGIAALTKVLLQFEHRMLVPSLHSEHLNPYLNLADTPFYVQQNLEKWNRIESQMPRRAAISAFGAGGSNAHLILEEYTDTREIYDEEDDNTERFIILSARDKESLKRRAEQLIEFCRNNINGDKSEEFKLQDIIESLSNMVTDILGLEAYCIDADAYLSEDCGMDEVQLSIFAEQVNKKYNIQIFKEAYYNTITLREIATHIFEKNRKTVSKSGKYSLFSLAYTLQTCRESMNERLAIIASSFTDLISKLNIYLEDGTIKGLQTSNINNYDDNLRQLMKSTGITDYLNHCIVGHDWDEIMKFWIIGADINWAILYEGKTIVRIPLPSYPFEKMRCWITEDEKNNMEEADAKIEKEVLDNNKQSDDEKNVLDYIKQAFTDVLKIPKTKLSETDDISDYGVDSIRINQLIKYFEKDLGRIPVSVFYTCKNLKMLEQFFSKNYKEYFEGVSDKGCRNIESEVMIKDFKEATVDQPIAIIGINGKFPNADTIEQYTDNLIEGKDCIMEIPKERWDYTQYPNIKCKWGGFINEDDCFDPQFFGIAPMNAYVMDPQERLFIQAVWSCIEDAGYTPETLGHRDINGRSNVAVYAGITFNEYGLYGANDLSHGKEVAINSQIYSVANRISYLLNLKGPSLSVDTACSSSLAAIHMACESLKNGEAELAIAGGVNLSQHPSKYITLNMSNFLSSDGHCHSFGEGGDGYVPGEGVGAILLKPLDKAIEDHDHIYGIIKGSALNHGGKTQGFTVPNPIAQAEVITKALEKANVDPDTITYIEAHGTGTALGDPIEIEALSKVYGNRKTKAKCAIGSVKGNIGHLEAASGISQVFKVLMQFQTGLIFMNRTNSKRTNPYIDFDNSPFYLQTKTEKWVPLNGANGAKVPRRAGISSFGVGGVNVHLIMEEYELEKNYSGNLAPYIIPISAKNVDSLRKYVVSLKNFVEMLPDKSKSTFETLADMAFTMQTGRLTMNKKVVFIGNSKGEILELFDRFLQDPEVYIDSIVDLSTKDFDRNIISCANKWLEGEKEDFTKCYNASFPYRCSLPTYPFLKEKYWLYEKKLTYVEDQENKEKLCKEKVELSILEQLRSLPEREWNSTILNYNQKLFSNLLAFQEGSLPDVDTGFFELGLESIATTKAYNILEEEYRLELDLQLFFNYPTIRKVSCYIEECLKKKLPKVQSEETLSEGELVYFKTTHEQKDIDQYVELSQKNIVLFTSIKSLGERLENAGVKHLRQIEIQGEQLVFDERRYNTKGDDVEIMELFSKVGVSNEEPNTFVYFSHDDNTDINNIFVLYKVALKKHIVFKLIYAFGCDTHHYSEKASVYGFLKALHFENPNYEYKVLRFMNNSLESPNILSGLVNEIRFGDYNRELVYQGDSRFEGVLQELTKPKENSEPVFREKGVYLITGGCGGLGIIFAKSILQEVNVNLILVGRRKAGEKEERIIQDLKTIGNSNVQYFSADISDSQNTKILINELKQKYGRINGVIHSAGVIRDSMFSSKTKEDFDSVLLPKIAGTKNLDKALGDEHLDFFVMFSSLASVLGNAGQTDYCYANSFLNEFAYEREKKREKGERFGKTLTISWPFWLEGGMKVNEDTRNWMQRKMGIDLLPTSTGLKAFRDAYIMKSPHIIVAFGNADKIKQMLGVRNANEYLIDIENCGETLSEDDIIMYKLRNELQQVEDTLERG